MEKDRFQDLFDKIKDINKIIRELEPLGEVKEVKKFNKSGHIPMEGKYVGDKVLIIKLPKEDISS